MAIQTVTSETLADFNAARMMLSEAPPEEKKQEVEAKAEEAEAKPAEEDDIPPEEAEAKEEKEEKPKKGLAKRFHELTSARDAERQAREAAEARAKALEEKLAAAEGRKPVQEPVDPDLGPKPNPKDYSDAFEYAEDLAEWNVNNALKERDKAEARAREEAKKGEVLKAWQTRLESAKSRIPDFEATIASSQVAFGDVVRDTIIESEYGPEVLHYFAEKDEEAEKLNKMTVKDALRFIGRLEARFEAAKESPEETKTEKAVEKVEKPVRKAPEPIQPIKSASPSSDIVNDPGEFKGSYKDWKAARLAKRA